MFTYFCDNRDINYYKQEPEQCFKHVNVQQVCGVLGSSNSGTDIESCGVNKKIIQQFGEENLVTAATLRLKRILKQSLEKNL
jgi:hypothetical protein